MAKEIVITGAREHNLKNVSLELPRDTFIVITGLSGSGKSTLGRGLAAALDLPFHIVIAKTDARPEQKTMANSTQQARNIDGSLELNGQPIPHGPVLLIDDMVDSRWTLTVSAWLLRKSCSGEVWPMALSQTGHDE